ncbi:hypothetical protein CUJ88_42390 [Paraburkholderia hospita]|jgi:DNA-binding transcriptional LysR family regulator|nr:hypothetical protein CUJ88_42390 [Paraburkholderia hospita]OUL69760.1 hypothetical protein CA603_50620 [Paraburkholderia hospita]
MLPRQLATNQPAKTAIAFDTGYPPGRAPLATEEAGGGPVYAFEQLALPHIRARKLKRVLSSFSPTFPGFYLYYPNRRQQPAKLKALVNYVLAYSRSGTIGMSATVPATDV